MLRIRWQGLDKKIAKLGVLHKNVALRHSRNWGEEVREVGEQTTLGVIMIGGMNPTKKGGPRIEYGDMIDSVRSFGKYTPDNAVVEAGYYDGPSWTKWQEEGTSTVASMDSMPETAKAMSRMRRPAGDRMLQAIRREWNAI